MNYEDKSRRNGPKQKNGRKDNFSAEKRPLNFSSERILNSEHNKAVTDSELYSGIYSENNKWNNQTEISTNDYIAGSPGNDQENSYNKYYNNTANNQHDSQINNFGADDTQNQQDDYGEQGYNIANLRYDKQGDTVESGYSYNMDDKEQQKIYVDSSMNYGYEIPQKQNRQDKAQSREYLLNNNNKASPYNNIPPYSNDASFDNQNGRIPSNNNYEMIPPSSQNSQKQNATMPYLTNTKYNLTVPHRLEENTRKSRKLYRIPLTSEGNLVIDLPIARQLSSLVRYKTPIEEFGYTRYTAITCGPEEFVSRGYRLKVQEMGGRAELLIALTMYNEDEHLFLRSMTSVLKNIRNLSSKTRSKVWGKDSWKKIVVCIIADGRNKVNNRTLALLGVMGVYQDGIMKDHVNEKSVTAHLFEYTSQIYINESFEIKNTDSGYCPTQIIFCLKENNAKKINSHRWLFQAFAPLLSTNVCILIDVGTRPSDDSLHKLWRAFKNPKIGGACGEIIADMGKHGIGLFNPLISAQNFEYKVSNILDKPLESVCGYISVLPGAFSAYRYSALIGRPLRAYFLGETMENEVSLLTANTYLAEDRILCLELVAKKGSSWLLKYVRSARAKTDVPSSFAELVSQRRRWLNGSFCAGIHALVNFYRIFFLSGHNIIRKLILSFEFFYNFIVIILNWFGISLFFLIFYFVLKGASTFDPTSPARPFLGYEETVLFYSKYVYVMSVIAVFISSMGNRPEGFKIINYMSVATFAIFNLVIIYVVGFQTYMTFKKTAPTLSSVPLKLITDKAFRTLAISILFSIGVFFITSIIYLSPWHMFTSSIQYLLIMPSYINIMPIYSFCNLHDVSWGTKQDTGPSRDLGTAKITTNEKGMGVFDVEIRGSQVEIDTNYRKFIKHLENKPSKKIIAKDIFRLREDYLRSFRTEVVLLWILTNGALSVALTSDLLSDAIYRSLRILDDSSKGVGDGAVNPFITFFSYITIFVNGTRLLGSIIYIISK